MIKRLLPYRWATISVWTAAAVGWGVAAAAVAQNANQEADEIAADPAPPPTTQVEPAADTTIVAAAPATTLPEMPESGLVVIRYTPVEPPPPKEIIRTVQAAPKAPKAAPAPAKAPAPKPAPKVKSKAS